MTIVRLMIALGVCCQCAPYALIAQTVFRVESGGLPVSGAEVSIWDGDRRSGIGRTAGAGVVRIVTERDIGEGAFVLVRRLGFAPARLRFAGGDTVTVTLSAVASALPVLSVNLKKLKCPTRHQSEADSIWRMAASRYKLAANSLVIDWTGYVVSETVPPEQRGYGDLDTFRPPVISDRVTGMPEAGMHEPPPYALFENHVGVGGKYSKWRYATLASYSAEHFVTERFRERHAMAVLGRTGTATIIGFCARDYAQAEIEGELQIGADSLLLAARWSFRVPHDDEDAGGEANFALTPYKGDSYLVAIRGSTWRRARPNLYGQSRFERVRWSLRVRDPEFWVRKP